MHRLASPILLILLVFALPSSAFAYQLSAEDVISVTVFDEPDLGVDEARVSSNGTVSLPLLGEVEVAGSTTKQVARRIEALLADGYLKKPRVSVAIKTYRQVYVNGAVNNPGGYSFQEGLTVHKAVVLAGGFNERASRSKITLVRETSPGVVRKATLNTKVRPGDVITVGESFF